MKNNKKKEEKEDIETVRRKFVEWANPMIEDLKKELNLPEVMVMLDFLEENLTGPMGSAIMQISENYPYAQAKIEVFPAAVKMFKSKNFEVLHMCLTHEMCHLLTNSFFRAAVDRFSSKDLIDNLNEQLTERVSHLLRMLLKLKNSKH